MDESDMKAGEPDQEGPKVEVQVNTTAPDNDVPLSGLFCIHCHGFAVHIYEGNSLCHECYNEEISDLIKEKHKK